MKNKSRQYRIFSRSGQLVGNLLWDAIRDIYQDSPDSIRAVYQDRKGRPQVRFVCSGLNASAEENRQELDAMKAARRAAGLEDFVWSN
jgi:hypothetical protein